MQACCNKLRSRVALRYFLDWSRTTAPPDPSLLTVFRQRLGLARWQAIWQEIVRQARRAGLVKDRLRLKDATHVIAHIAVPTTIQRGAQTRDQLLRAAESFAATEGAAHRQAAADLRTATSAQPNEVRLLRRVEHLRTLVTWGAVWHERLDLGAPPVAVEVYARLRHRTRPGAPSLAGSPTKARPINGARCRTSRRGAANTATTRMAICSTSCSTPIPNSSPRSTSGLPTATKLSTPRALLAQEESAQGNDGAALSIDRVGFNGAVLQALSDAADGPQVTVYVPPKPDWSPTPELFQARDFTLNEAGDELPCPGGQTTRTRNRDSKDHGWRYHFRAAQCRTCPLRAQCVTSKNQSGRQVSQNDYQAQYDAARVRATSDDYQPIRKEHPAIERKLNELVRWHDGRRVRYRGRQVPYLILAVVVNCKRIVRLLSAAPSAAHA